jgi:L-arabinose transport system substrate-binding protein
MSKLKPNLVRNLSVVALTALVAAGCSSGATTTPSSSPSGDASPTSSGTAGTASPSASGPITIALINKQGTQQYFVDQADGSKAAAAELGDVTVNVQDVQLDANAAINAINTAIAQGVDGIIITVPDPKIGPEVIKLATAAGIPIMATNDTISDADGTPAPYAGFSGFAMGQQVGEKAGELYNESGWDATNTAVINIQKQDLPTCVERGQGALAAFTETVGADLPPVIDLGTDASAPQALDRTGAIVTANPDVKNWVVWGCNDESETGGVLALKNAGFGADNVIGVGLGAYLTCKDWKAGEVTGNKAALSLSGVEVGKLSVNLMVESLRDGTPLPEDSKVPTQIVDATNWEQAGVMCS